MIKKTITIFLLLFSQHSFSYNYSKILKSKFSSWGVNKGKFSIENTDIYDGLEPKKEIIVAVIDTGIDFNHPFLKENIYSKGKVSKLNYGVDFSTGKMTNEPKDIHGHGTHVSGIIKSVFPYVKILPIKYYNPAASGEDNLNATIKSLEYAVKMNVDIINYSGGGPTASIEELKILKEAEKKGITIIAASGNERSNIDDLKYAYYPASYGLSNIITVSSYNKDLMPIPSANYGVRSVDILAPGHRIKSSFPDGLSGYMTGTSQATAFVTGVASLLKALHPSLTPVELKNIIAISGTELAHFKGKTKNAKKINTKNAIVLANQYTKSINRNISSDDVIKQEEISPNLLFNFSQESTNELIKQPKNLEKKSSRIFIMFVLTLSLIAFGIIYERKVK